ncbi:fimbrial protein [Salmonella enterica]|nr:fimbrial protein [Salmonella enterica]ECO1003996.1 fimbrial protein [Salmonella enterica subsp. enterica serovar Give]ECS8314109.1 fimbrial protein [Salmonella enterica subsp. enterica serovar Panama]ECT7813259.1 fimbrial protein [Salmonella enterica subsp. enterica serovar 9,12:-:1,5]ECY3797562.1 fimbrial protein [Salmonella enterica subsp. enterica serovar Minnesota]
MMAHLQKLLLLGGAWLLMSGNVGAAEVGVHITGTLTIPPCTINSGQVINVNFGNVLVTDLSNVSYHKKTTVSVACPYYKGTPWVKVNGTQLSGAGDNVLSTNISGFGIALYQGDGVSIPLHLNGVSPYGAQIISGFSGKGTANGTFTFTAVPYKVGTDQLSGGDFSATASMTITYI